MYSYVHLLICLFIHLFFIHLFILESLVSDLSVIAAPLREVPLALPAVLLIKFAGIYETASPRARIKNRF